MILRTSDSVFVLRSFLYKCLRLSLITIDGLRFALRELAKK